MFCLICVYKVFHEMVERDLNLNFWVKLGGCTSHILGSLWLVGKVKWNWFGWVLINGDLHICYRFNFKLSFEWGCQMFLQVWKVGFDSLLLVLARGEKNWEIFYLKSWTRNTQSDLVSKIGKKWPFALSYLFWFSLVLFLHENVLYDVIFIFKPFLAI